MAQTPAWFDKDFYLQQKAAQLNNDSIPTPDGDADSSWDADSVAQGFEDAGFTAFSHFQQFGQFEGLSPDPLFDADYYLNEKADALNAAGSEAPDGGDWDAGTLAEVYHEMGLSAWSHYNQYGWQEGLNPSEGFDNEAYLEAKAAELNENGSTNNGEPWDAESVEAGFADAGLSPLEHYTEYGVNEGVDYTPEGGTGPTGPQTELTTEVDDVQLGAGDDVINGTVSALSSEGTLNPGDHIDGGDGNDTLQVQLDSSFTGFNNAGSNDGGLENVENVVLVNDGSIARTFNAKDIEGVESYDLTGNIRVTNLENVPDVAVHEQAKGTIDLGFTTDAVAGSDDTLNLTVDNVGTPEITDEDGKVTTTPEAVDLSADGIENVNVTATGDNVLDLDATDISVAGEDGSLVVTNTGNAVTSFDASGYAGDVDVTLGASNAGLVATGAGDDVIHSSGLRANATIDGGAGDDTLVIDNNPPTTTQFDLSNVENIELGGAAAGATVSLAHAQGVQAVNVTGAVDGTTVAGLTNAPDLSFNLGADSEGKLTADNEGVSTVNAEAGAEANLELSNSNAVRLTTQATDDAAYTGDLIAHNAQSLTVDGTLDDNTITVNNATEAVFNDAATNNRVTLKADDLQGLTVHATGEVFDIGDSALASLHNVSLDGLADFDLHNLGQTSNEYGLTVNADGVNSLVTGDLQAQGDINVTVDAVGSNIENLDAGDVDSDAVALGIYGDTISKEGDITVNVSATDNVMLQHDFKANDVTFNIDTTGDVEIANTGLSDGPSSVDADSVTINASQVLGVINVGQVSAKSDVTLNGSDLSVNTMHVDATGTDLNVSFDGGLAADELYVNGNNESDASGSDDIDGYGDLTITGDMGLGADTVVVTADTDGGTIDVTGLLGLGDDDSDSLALNGGDGDDVFVIGANQAGVDSFSIAGNSGDSIDLSALGLGTLETNEQNFSDGNNFYVEGGALHIDADGNGVYDAGSDVTIDLVDGGSIDTSASDLEAGILAFG